MQHRWLHCPSAVQLQLLAALIVLRCSSNSVSALSRQPTAFTLPLTRRDGVARTRGLLRNASLPLHGAVRDYGWLSSPQQPPPPLPLPIPIMPDCLTVLATLLSRRSQIPVLDICMCILLWNGSVGTLAAVLHSHGVGLTIATTDPELSR